jgi:hypothetical protein
VSGNQIISDLPTLVGVGATSGLASSLLTAFLTPKIQHRFWIRQQKFDSCFSSLKELHRISAEIERFFYDHGWPLTPDEKASVMTIVYSWVAATEQTRFLFSEKVTEGLNKLNAAVGDALLSPPEEKTVEARFEAFDKFRSQQEKTYKALYDELFARRPFRLPSVKKALRLG